MMSCFIIYKITREGETSSVVGAHTCRSDAVEELHSLKNIHSDNWCSICKTTLDELPVYFEKSGDKEGTYVYKCNSCVLESDTDFRKPSPDLTRVDTEDGHYQLDEFILM